MSDPRFARLKSDPRFRRVRQKEAKVVLDDRFKSIFDEGGKKDKKDKKGKGRVDKYGRTVSDTHEQDDLRRFYRLEGGEEAPDGEPSTSAVDYARGAVLMESSDEEDGPQGSDDESDTGGVVTLGADVSKPIRILGDDDEDAEPEVDLDEDNFADLDAQAADYAKALEDEAETPEVAHTRRLAVVNLDWDHVRAIHLYKIFTSLVSPTASALPSVSTSSSKKGKDRAGKSTTSRVVRGKVLSVRVYPSQFGKERMAREETEGPPAEVFSKKEDGADSADDQNDNGEDYNEAALRKYQLERLRYYYAIVECDTVEAASHLYSELEGSELERSANVFDLSFVPDDMTFDEQFRDEATEDVNAPYKPVEFVTDALRHSKVKLTWDDDDAERVKVTRRTFTRKEMEENDFRAYIATSSEDESETETKGKADREKLRALLLSGGNDLPEGWGKGFADGDDNANDIDMQVTFAPGLSETKSGDETTLEKYQRKMKEKKKKRKEELKEKVAEVKAGKGEEDQDDFFANDSDDDVAVQKEPKSAQKRKGKLVKAKHAIAHDDEPEETVVPRAKATAGELALIAASDNPNGEPKHFDMKAVIKAEKGKGKKRKGKKGAKAVTGEDGEANELQEDFSINVKDDRFKAVLDDHTFAIDPSNPHFKKTKSMSALLDERSKRQKEKTGNGESAPASSRANAESKTNLKSLVESVKRKSAVDNEKHMGKRRKL